MCDNTDFFANALVTSNLQTGCEMIDHQLPPATDF